jgi:hypothetical protein
VPAFCFLSQLFAWMQKAAKKSRQNMLPPALGNPVIVSQRNDKPL